MIKTHYFKLHRLGAPAELLEALKSEYGMREVEWEIILRILEKEKLDIDSGTVSLLLEDLPLVHLMTYALEVAKEAFRKFKDVELSKPTRNLENLGGLADKHRSILEESYEKIRNVELAGHLAVSAWYHAILAVYLFGVRDYKSAGSEITNAIANAHYVISLDDQNAHSRFKELFKHAVHLSQLTPFLKPGWDGV